jgi:hypothetical protein
VTGAWAGGSGGSGAWGGWGGWGGFGVAGREGTWADGVCVDGNWTEGARGVDVAAFTRGAAVRSLELRLARRDCVRSRAVRRLRV